MQIDTTGLAQLGRFFGKLSALPEDSEFQVSELAADFHEVLNSGEIPRLLKREISGIAENSLYRPPGDSTRYMQLFLGPKANVLLQKFTPEDSARNLIWTAPYNFLAGVLSPGGVVKLRYYRPTAEWNNSVYDPDLQLAFERETSMTAGEFVSVPRDGELVQFTVTSPVIMLRMASTDSLDYQWLFDGDSLKPIFMSSSSQMLTRNETLITVAQEFHRSGYIGDEIADALERLTHHPLHNVRWQATQVLFRVNRPMGMEALQKALGDPHPHVAKAANLSLSRLQSA